jgi:hydrogenase maturation protease
MLNLREQLQQLLQGRVCLMGLGNVVYGDDGFGVRLAEALISSASTLSSRCRVIIAGTTPEWLIGRAVDHDCDHLVFLDAAEFGGAPGSVVLLNSDELVARFPQVSTHKLSLGLLAKQVESNGRTKAWLLAVQPESLRPGENLTPTVAATLELLLNLFQTCLHGRSRGNEALMSRGPWPNPPGYLSLVTSAPTPTTEVRA